MDKRFDVAQIQDKDSHSMIESAESQVERSYPEHANILRWEDDGGQMIDYRNVDLTGWNNLQTITAGGNGWLPFRGQ